ncbi:unnamed protein product [Symbiodinium necroappetens]|uniref:Saposin B-type domain-containing protein n=1 Tax=Symbiodinium necroappetens TaxID=1628268 RepID=A0A812M4T1_9DINO|nr:unnamed protein product [Symbiodinium necroappetens]
MQLSSQHVSLSSMPLLVLLVLLMAGRGQCHDGPDHELLAAIKRQMDSIPEPPVDITQIRKDLRCTYCHAVASTFTRALDAKTKALPPSRHGLKEEECSASGLMTRCSSDPSCAGFPRQAGAVRMQVAAARTWREGGITVETVDLATGNPGPPSDNPGYIKVLVEACEKPVQPGDLESQHFEARHLKWLCGDILQTLGEEDVWELFQKHAEVPAARLCSRKLRLCPKESPRRRNAMGDL